MFDILLGRKFSNKCKHSVKYIKCRIETIRKKKQVMVRYLKKDVADLLAGGHDDNAFGRIDALIVEINHVSCYDMIEQYCGCFLEHLSTICKERECPKEALEAVATLIFAAARFSDLPELADLRTVFTNRYGTRMESSIDKEFVEKIQKKSFSKARKLQLMEDLAQEFSVNWNSNMFEKKMSNQSAPTHGKAMKHQLVTKEKEKPFPTTAPPEHQIQPKEQKDLQTTPTNTNQNKKYRNDSILEGNSLGRSVMVINTIPPPYTKLKVVSNGTTADHCDLAHSEASEDVKELDRNGEDRWPHRRRTFNSQPPYRKPNVNVIPNDTNYVNPQDNMPKDEIFEDDSNISSQIQTKQGRETAKANDIHGEVYDEQRFIIKQTPSSRRRHGSRRAVETTKDGGYDKEEEIMDKLLMHYSKKGTNNEPRKTRMNMRGAPIEPIANAARVPEHLDEHKRYLNTLPRELTSPAENEKPARRMPLRQPENENRAEMDRPALRNS